MTIVHAQWLTVGFIATTMLLILGFDVWVTVRYGADASISRVLNQLFARWPSVFVALVFWLGLLVGHIWLPAR